MNAHLVGSFGETCAVQYFRSLGYEILICNFRGRMGEIDLIARDGETLVFCEVKTRVPSPFMRPMEAVDRHKQKKLIATAKWYLAEQGEEQWSRFDVIEVFVKNENEKLIQTSLNHIKNAFELAAGS